MSDPPPSVPSSVTSDLTNRSLGDFRLLRRLGTGGMAEVYLAEQTSLSRPVAVKILQTDAVGRINDTLLKRFEQEARAAGGLSHPNIVQVYMIGHEEGLHFIVQEYVPGQNLNQWFTRHGPPEFLQGLKWMKQVAQALKAAAEASIVHRDIKPENIMLTRDLDAKVTDFGLAQLNEPAKKMNLTQAGTTMGTPWYMSPEQIQGEPLDHRSDQYSFGVTCYHMFAGEPPFSGKNSVTVAVQHLKDTPTPLSKRRRDLPEGLCQVIHRMMARDPEDRFSSPEELVEALNELDHASVNPDLVDTSTFMGWLRSSMPSSKLLAAGLVGCMLAGLWLGQGMFRPVRLQLKPAGIVQEETAARQYATALLNSRNEAAWQAVWKFYPKSEEALWARLQLGLQYINRTIPDFTRADAMFQELTQEAARETGQKKRDLQFLALLGRAMCADTQLDALLVSSDDSTMSAQTRQRTEQLRELRRDLISNRLLTQYKPELERGSLEAPSLLRDYYQELRIELNFAPAT
ncbi:MAG: serine/threonine-protein kinase [Planctomycetaceae bacterium]